MPRASRQPPSELPPGKLGAVSAELALAGRNGLSRSKPKAGAPPDGGSNVTAGRIVAPHAELGYGISARTPKTEILVFVFLPLAELAAVVGKVPVRVWILAGISVLAIPRWSGYSNPRLGCKVFVFLSRSMLRSLPFGSLNAARSPRSSSLEGFSPTRLRVVPSSATQRLFSVAAVARYPPGTGSAQIRPSISANSLRLRCPSANSSQ